MKFVSRVWQSELRRDLGMSTGADGFGECRMVGIDELESWICYCAPRHHLSCRFSPSSSLSLSVVSLIFRSCLSFNYHILSLLSFIFLSPKAPHTTQLWTVPQHPSSTQLQRRVSPQIGKGSAVVRLPIVALVADVDLYPCSWIPSDSAQVSHLQIPTIWPPNSLMSAPGPGIVRFLVSLLAYPPLLPRPPRLIRRRRLRNHPWVDQNATHITVVVLLSPRVVNQQI